MCDLEPYFCIACAVIQRLAAGCSVEVGPRPRSSTAVVPHFLAALTDHLRRGNPWVLLRGVFKKGNQGMRNIVPWSRSCHLRALSSRRSLQLDLFTEPAEPQPLFLKQPEPSRTAFACFPVAVIDVRGPKAYAMVVEAQRCSNHWVFRKDRSRCHGWRATASGAYGSTLQAVSVVSVSSLCYRRERTCYELKEGERGHGRFCWQSHPSNPGS